MLQRLHLAHSPSRRRFALALGAQTVRVWELDSQRRLEDPHDGAPEDGYGLDLDTRSGGLLGVCFVSDGVLISVHAEGVVRAWRIERHGEMASQDSDPYATWMHEASGASAPIVAGGWRQMPPETRRQEGTSLFASLLWELDVRVKLQSCELQHERASWRQVRVALGGAAGEVLLLDVFARRAPELRALGQLKSPIVRVALTEDGSCLASAGRDRTIAVWQLHDVGPEERAAGPWRVFEGSEGEIWAMAFSHSGRYLVSGGIDNGIYFWDLLAKNALRAVSHDHRGWVGSLAWSDDDHVVASASWDNTVGLFRAGDLMPLYCFEHHRDYAAQVVFIPDTSWLVSASYDRTLAVWDWHHAEQVTTFEGHTDWVQTVRWLGQGQLLSASSDRTLRIWSINTLRCLRVLGDERAQPIEMGGLGGLSEGSLVSMARRSAQSASTSFPVYRSSGFGEQRVRGAAQQQPVPQQVREAVEAAQTGLGQEVSLIVDDAPMLASLMGRGPRRAAVKPEELAAELSSPREVRPERAPGEQDADRPRQDTGSQRWRVWVEELPAAPAEPPVDGSSTQGPHHAKRQLTPGELAALAPSVTTEESGLLLVETALRFQEMQLDPSVSPAPASDQRQAEADEDDAPYELEPIEPELSHAPLLSMSPLGEGLRAPSVASTRTEDSGLFELPDDDGPLPGQLRLVAQGAPQQGLFATLAPIPRWGDEGSGLLKLDALADELLPEAREPARAPEPAPEPEPEQLARKPLPKTLPGVDAQLLELALASRSERESDLATPRSELEGWLVEQARRQDSQAVEEPAAGAAESDVSPVEAEDIVEDVPAAPPAPVTPPQPPGLTLPSWSWEESEPMPAVSPEPAPAPPPAPRPSLQLGNVKSRLLGKLRTQEVAASSQPEPAALEPEPPTLEAEAPVEPPAPAAAEEPPAPIEERAPASKTAEFPVITLPPDALPEPPAPPSHIDRAVNSTFLGSWQPWGEEQSDAARGAGARTTSEDDAINRASLPSEEHGISGRTTSEDDAPTRAALDAFDDEAPAPSAPPVTPAALSVDAFLTPDLLEDTPEDPAGFAAPLSDFSEALPGRPPHPEGRAFSSHGQPTRQKTAPGGQHTISINAPGYVAAAFDAVEGDPIEDVELLAEQTSANHAPAAPQEGTRLVRIEAPDSVGVPLEPARPDAVVSVAQVWAAGNTAGRPAMMIMKRRSGASAAPAPAGEWRSWDKLKTPMTHVAAVVSDDEKRLLVVGGRSRDLIAYNAQLERLWDVHTHGSQVHAALIAGRILIAGSDDALVHLWALSANDREAPAQHAVLDGHAGPVTRLVMAPSGKVLLSGSEDGTARIWSLEDGREVATLQHDAPLGAVAFGTRGPITADEAPAVRIWDSRGIQLDLLEGFPAAVTALGVHKSALYVGCADGSVFLCSPGKREALPGRHRGPVRDIKLLPGGELIAICGAGGLLQLLSPGEAGALQLLDLGEPLEQATLLGQQLVVGTASGALEQLRRR